MKYRILFLFSAFNLIATFCCIYGQTKIVWTKTFGGGKSDQIYWVEQTSDKGFILAGQTKSFGAGDSDAWLIRLNKKGDTVWSRTYGGPRNDFAEGVIEMKDGGFVFAGGTRSFGAGIADVWIIRTNLSGDTLWTKTYGGAKYDMPFCIIQTADKNFAFTGRKSIY